MRELKCPSCGKPLVKCHAHASKLFRPKRVRR